jgi:tetratricopeptide (TPR) repeat protein
LRGKSPQQTVDELGPYVSTVARLLPNVAVWLTSDQSALQSEVTDQQLLHGLLATFDRLINQGPSLVIVEDIHWADEASLDTFLHLARSAPTRALLLVLTMRGEDAGPSVIDFRGTLARQRLITELVLGPLDRDEVEAMVGCIIGEDPRSQLIETIVALTEGNPFFVEELVRTAIASGRDRLAEGGLGVPRTVHDAVQRRVHGLSEAARYILQLAAVTGRRFDFALLQSVSGINERDLLAIVKEMMAAQLVVEESEDRFAFRHALTREAVYLDLVGRERRVLHSDILRALELTEAHAWDELSYHSHAAAEWGKTIACASEAGERALGMHAPRAAVEHFGRAIDAAQKLGQSPAPEALRGRGHAHHNLGEFEPARAGYEATLAAATAAGDRHLLWQSLVDLNLLWSARDYAIAGEYAERSLIVAQALNDKSCIARSLDRVGNWHMNTGRIGQALTCQQQALDLLESIGDRRGVAETLNLLGMTSAFIDSEQSSAYYTRAIPLAREFDNRQDLVTALVMRVLASGFYYADTLAPAPRDSIQNEVELQEAIRLAQVIDWPAGEAFARWESALWYGMRGQYARAFDMASGGLRIAEDIQHAQWITAGLCSLGALYVDVLVAERARSLLERALALAHELGSLVWTPYAAARLAQAFTLRRDFPKASAVLEPELHADKLMDTITERQLWCARGNSSWRWGQPAKRSPLPSNWQLRWRLARWRRACGSFGVRR